MTLGERIQRQFGRGVVKYGLITDGDSILVGLSGGKDSLCLLELLARRSKVRVPHFTVQALHVRMENIHYETDTMWLQQFCQQLDVPLHVVTTGFDSSISTHHSSLSTLHSSLKQKPACFLCSWQRRKQLFNLAQSLGCNKIALGHHLDDILHTALMNLTFQGHFSTMPALLKLRKMPLTIIRPLCMVSEADIAAYAEQQGYRKQLKQCPYERETHRTSAKELLNQMQQLNPEARFSLWNALDSAGKLVEY